MVLYCTGELKHFSHLIRAVPTPPKNSISAFSVQRGIVKPDANITIGCLDLTGCLHHGCDIMTHQGAINSRAKITTLNQGEQFLWRVLFTCLILKSSGHMKSENNQLS